jgi:hypothetical protein
VTGTIKARPTLYKGVRMRSRLEADYAAHLDHAGYAWKYEPECFASPDGQWLPDFRVTWPGGDPAQESFIELKPAGRLDADWGSPGPESIDGHLTRMTIAWASKPEAELILLYWQYGGPAVMEIISQGKDAPWLAEGGRFPLLWTGMGQYNRCDLGRQVSGG